MKRLTDSQLGTLETIALADDIWFGPIERYTGRAWGTSYTDYKNPVWQTEKGQLHKGTLKALLSKRAVECAIDGRPASLDEGERRETPESSESAGKGTIRLTTAGANALEQAIREGTLPSIVRLRTALRRVE